MCKVFFYIFVYERMSGSKWINVGVQESTEFGEFLYLELCRESAWVGCLLSYAVDLPSQPHNITPIWRTNANIVAE
jgi:hypothetical protein